MAVDLKACRNTSVNIALELADDHMFNAGRVAAMINLLCDEIETLRTELQEYRASLQAKQETVKMGEGRGIHTP